MELTGKVIAILPARSGVSQRTGKEWATQQYVIETSGQYPKKMVFEIFGADRIKEANIQMNEEINVQFDIDASEYKGSWYNTIRAYKVVHMNPDIFAQQPAVRPAPQQPFAQPYAPSPSPSTTPEASAEENSDDLPF